MFSPEEMQSPFETIKETDAEGREWWNSRKLARLMGYQKYWNFERLMDKMAIFLQQEKGLDLKEHMVEIEEMAQLGSGTTRQVFAVDVSTINYHLKQIDESGEVHLSEAIRKIQIPSEKWDEQGITMMFYKTVQNMMHYAVTNNQ